MMEMMFTIDQAAAFGEPVDCAFTAQVDGSPQRYVQLLPVEFDPQCTHHAMIALHGHGSDRWQFATDSRDECRAARDVAARHGMIYVSPDYRAATSWMGPTAEADLLQIIADLRAKYHIGCVFLFGASMGGSSALTFSAMHPDLIDGVCAMNATANHLEYCNFQDAIAESFGGGKEEIPLEYKRRSAEYWPERFSMPVALTAGGADTSVPPHSVVRFADVLTKMGRRVSLLYREHGEHETSYIDSVSALEYVIRTALEPETRDRSIV